MFLTVGGPFQGQQVRLSASFRCFSLALTCSYTRPHCLVGFVATRLAFGPTPTHPTLYNVLHQFIQLFQLTIVPVVYTAFALNTTIISSSEPEPVLLPRRYIRVGLPWINTTTVRADRDFQHQAAKEIKTSAQGPSPSQHLT